MSIGEELREPVRRRAHFACEYCGVSEADTGDQLTLDHYQPRARGGTEGYENLVYCCYRCNLYKADYWPSQPGEPWLWNPCQELRENHLLPLADGNLYPITPTGIFTLQRLRLNREPLVAYRLRKQSLTEEERLITRFRDFLTLLERLFQQQASLLDEQHALLEEQRNWLRLLKEKAP